MEDEKLCLLNCDSDYVKTSLYNSIEEQIDVAFDFHNHDRRYLVCHLVMYAKIITRDNIVYDNIVSFYFSNSGIKLKYKVDREDFSDDFFIKQATVNEKSIKYIKYGIEEETNSTNDFD
ncbi:MAG: hypothetical protein JST55_13240 [Bacteroidetes bacterium]|nr:hypothetical protein [Bacteroidota bacterium]